MRWLSYLNWFFMFFITAMEPYVCPSIHLSTAVNGCAQYGSMAVMTLYLYLFTGCHVYLIILICRVCHQIHVTHPYPSNNPFFLVLMVVYGCAHGFHGSHELGFAALLVFIFYGNNQWFELKEHDHILKLRPTFYYNACDVNSFTYELDDAGHQWGT